MTKNPEKELSILLPAYNEASQIEQCILEVEETVRNLSDSYEIIVSEDGSTDGTEEIVTKMANVNPNLRLLHSKERLGKGKAIRNAVNCSQGQIIAFMDVDRATDLACLPKLLDTVKQKGGMAIGSRHIPGSNVQRHAKRTLFSLTYNAMVRLLFLDGVRDHQCGFKTMKTNIAKAVLNSSKSDGYFFDTEMIIRCKQLGYPVTEVPVNWMEHNKDSKVDPARDSGKIFRDMLSFRLGRK